MADDPMDDDIFVKERLEQLLSEHDPRSKDPETFLGAQFELGLAWVQFPAGHGGLGIAPIHQRRVDDELKRVRCPLLAIHGDRDEYGSRRHPERIAALVSGPSEVAIIENAGHMIHRESPDELLHAVAGFLARAEEPSTLATDRRS